MVRRPLRVALLTSRRAPALPYLLEDDPNRGRLWEPVAAVTSDPECEELDRLESAGVPTAVHDLRQLYRRRGVRSSDLAVREEYDWHTRTMLRCHRPDLVALCGYLHILTAPMLEPYAARIVNVHDSDLAVLDTSGRPRYVGLRSTRDAIFAGERETRSTVHIVTAEVDLGPPLVRSWAFPVHPLAHDARAWHAIDIIKAYAYAQREWMMRASWGPLLARAIALFAAGRLRLLDGRAVVDETLGPVELDDPAGSAGEPAALRGRGGI